MMNPSKSFLPIAGVALILFALGCNAPPPQQLPDIESTVRARVGQVKEALTPLTAVPLPTYTPYPTFTPQPTLDLQATVEAIVEKRLALVEAVATPTPEPPDTPDPTSTPLAKITEVEAIARFRHYLEDQVNLNLQHNARMEQLIRDNGCEYPYDGSNADCKNVVEAIEQNMMPVESLVGVSRSRITGEYQGQGTGCLRFILNWIPATHRSTYQQPTRDILKVSCNSNGGYLNRVKSHQPVRVDLCPLSLDHTLLSTVYGVPTPRLLGCLAILRLRPGLHTVVK